MYTVRKKQNENCFCVKDLMGNLHSKHATRSEAKKQVKMLTGMKGGVVPMNTQDLSPEQLQKLTLLGFNVAHAQAQQAQAELESNRVAQIRTYNEYLKNMGLAQASRRRVKEIEQAEEDRMIRNAIRDAKYAKETQLAKDKKKGWFGLGKATGKMRIGMGLTKKQTEDFIKASYAKKKDANEINGYFLDKSLSSKKNKVYVNPEGKVIVANAGTSNVKDWFNNAYVPFGLYHTTNRYKDAEKIQKEAIDKYGKENITNVGHSQSGELLRNLADRGLTNEAVALNPYIIGKKHEGVDVIRSSGDLVSMMTPNVKETIPSKTWNPYTEHMPNVLGRGKKNRKLNKK